MKLERYAGLLLHPTSLPGPDGIGDLGPHAYRWLDFLAETGCKLWQVLPLGPTSYGDSPYQCFSAFAGNPYLVSPQALLDDGLLLPEDLADRPDFPTGFVDYGRVIDWKLTVLDRAYNRFQAGARPELEAELAAFQQAQADWLEDFVLFMAIKEAHNEGGPWEHWPAALRRREPQALAKAIRTYAAAMKRHAFRQFVFFRQWNALHAYAGQKGIRILGDAPIFVAYDSADVWAHPELFYLDSKQKPTVVAGVPPDYFSPTGQLWGNPLYRWDVHAETGYAWWIARMRSVLQQVDLIRLDHFRGFAGYWEVPASETTAIKGRWVKGPGDKLFYALQNALGDLPILAEDLGRITPDVIALRKQFGFPGMKILQFAFDSDATNPDLPFNFEHNSVVYAGTHDNDTIRGWYDTRSEEIRHKVRLYLGVDGHDISWDMIRLVLSSVVDIAVILFQDMFSLGSGARMNWPGRPSGNWQWRCWDAALEDRLVADRLRTLLELYGRTGLPRDETGNLGDWIKEEVNLAAP